jgi:hypothetical protein
MEPIIFKFVLRRSFKPAPLYCTVLWHIKKPSSTLDRHLEEPLDAPTTPGGVANSLDTWGGIHEGSGAVHARMLFTIFPTSIDLHIRYW